MARVFLGFPNWVDADPQYATVVFSGGSWSTALPLENLANEKLVNVSRTTDTQLSSTFFEVELGKQRQIQGLFIPTHNVSLEGRVRWTLARDASFSVIQYQSPWYDAWPITYPFGSIPFEHESWFTGKLTEETVGNSQKAPLIQVFNSPVSARYLRVEIDDQNNADGYIELSRLFVCGGWQPNINMLYGAGLGLETTTTVEKSLGGQKFFNSQPLGRVVEFELDALSEDEALTWVYELQRQLGISKQFMFVWNPDDTTHLHRRAFLANLSSLSPIRQLYHNTHSVSFSASEVL